MKKIYNQPIAETIMVNASRQLCETSPGYALTGGNIPEDPNSGL